MPYHTYILRCADDSFYVGHCRDLSARAHRHNLATAAKFTASRRPVILVWHEDFQDEASAVARERQIKRWTRRKKEALIAGDLPRLHALARSRD